MFGGSGQTGQHFVNHALKAGHRVRVLARNPRKITATDANLEVNQGSIEVVSDWAALVPGADYIVAMLGDREMQQSAKINAAFVRTLIPVMRRNAVRRFLYQAGGLSAVPGRALPPALRVIRKTVARSFEGQHQDNEAVMHYLMHEATDIEWMVHRAGIGSNGPSKGVLHRSADKFSVGTFSDCASYNLRIVMDPTAVHTCDFSTYQETTTWSVASKEHRPG
ncbi:NmrA family protein [Actinoplanes sp. N902-109]|nr:NmrA family protein [Actinoplanes sp. N902-109]